MRRVKRRQRKKKREKEDKDSRSTSASVSALLQLSKPDIWYLLFAFFSLVIAAIAQALVPKYTGEVINYVSEPVPDKEGFYNTLWLLVTSAVVCGIFSGLRGATFTLCMARLVIRVRHKLFKALLEQEVRKIGI
jgi:ABC-type multidrug transport system fused ATPase/permease subunit